MTTALQKKRKEINDMLISLGFESSTRAANIFHGFSEGEKNVKLKFETKGNNFKVYWNGTKVRSIPMSPISLENLEKYIIKLKEA